MNGPPANGSRGAGKSLSRKSVLSETAGCLRQGILGWLTARGGA